MSSRSQRHQRERSHTRVGASRIGFSGSPRRRQGSSLRFDPACGGAHGLDERLGRATGGQLRDARGARLRIKPFLFKEKFHVRHIDHAQHRSDDQSAYAPLPRLHHDCTCRTDAPSTLSLYAGPLPAMSWNSSWTRCPSTVRGHARRRASSSSTVRNSLGSAPVRTTAHRLAPADPSSSASPRCSTGSGNGFKSQ